MAELQFYIFLMLTAEVFMFGPNSFEARFESWTSIGSIVEFRIRLLGRDHRVNGTLILREDLGNDFSIAGETFSDRTGSGTYKQLPFTAPEMPFCMFLNSYWRYIEASVEFGTNTNFPFMNHTCPIPKGEYYIKDVLIKPVGWPHVIPRGFVKGLGTLSKDNEVVGTEELVISITDRTDA